MKPRTRSWPVVLASLAWATGLSLTAWGQTTGGPYQLYTVTPCRLVDTRNNQGATQLVGSMAQDVTVKGACGVPMTAKAVVMNLTGVSPSQAGNINAWAKGTTYPQTNLLNIAAGETALSNGAIVTLGSGTPDLSVVYGTASGSGTCDLIIDVVGYFQ